MKRILINAANLHAGGGVQVAASFINELLADGTLVPHGLDITVFASKEVMGNLNSGAAENTGIRLVAVDVHGMKRAPEHIRSKFHGFDLCFTVFGPMYFDVRCKKHLCGFAQAWIAYPRNRAYQVLPPLSRLVTRFKFSVQWFFFKKADHFVVELEHVRDALDRRGYPKGRISVVQNCASSLYREENRWRPLDGEVSFDTLGIVLGFLGRGYPHKNLAILKEVSRLLHEQYKLPCNFLFTLDKAEMTRHGFAGVENFKSVGPIDMAQCPSFYQNIDGLVFPSVLECFSATPIEAMIMKKPVFASDLPFVRDICGEHAHYFQPFNAADIAQRIAQSFADPKLLSCMTESAYFYALSSPTAKARAKGYVTLIEKVLNK
ncbi:glycosyltransferase [Vogesella indigofera]|uniref:glycosyltransferase n=1 Tax=Vogesella indigofera TaxID=45465 RepID=UPI00234F532B|nr:glycosyltransferase [Vogesella indigofera]MDC7696781.1 glycosyltransferase [Vogesella indigofera]